MPIQMWELILTPGRYHFAFAKIPDSQEGIKHRLNIIEKNYTFEKVIDTPELRVYMHPNTGLVIFVKEER